MASNNAEVIQKKAAPDLKSLTGPILIFLLAVFFFVLAGKMDDRISQVA